MAATKLAACQTLALTPVAASDLESLVALRIEAMRESLLRIGRFDATRARERFAAGFAPQHTRHIEYQGERVGFLAIKPLAGALLLDHFYIHPRHQSRGIGAAALRQVFDQADAAGLPLRVGALRGSDSNRFYRRHGFRLVEEAEWDLYYLRDAICTEPLQAC